MNATKHGLSVEMEKIDSTYILTFKAVGKLTHEDYEKLSPMLDSALNDVPNTKVCVLFDTSEMEGWDLRAALDDLKLGLKHGGKFEKVAVYGDKNWQKLATKIGAWFMSGDVRFFERYDAAVEFIKQ